MPMDDASLAPEGGDMPMDPGMGGGAPEGGDMSMDPGMGEEMPVGGEMPMDPGMGGDETMNIINKLSPKDKEAVKAYAESLSSKDEGNDEMPEGGDMPMQDGLNMEAPVNETYIFKKKQLNNIMENFANMGDDSKPEKNKQVKKYKNSNINSPFNSPFK